MEIHPPTHPLTSRREIAVELAVITAGILIALSLEGVVTWMHHRSVAREATENLHREISANRKDLAELLANIPKYEKEMAMVVQLVDEVRAKKPLTIQSIFLQVQRGRSAVGKLEHEPGHGRAGLHELQRRAEIRGCLRAATEGAGHAGQAAGQLRAEYGGRP